MPHSLRVNILAAYEDATASAIYTDTLMVPCDLKPLSAYSTQELIDEIINRERHNQPMGPIQ